jgi:hypothetical protein
MPGITENQRFRNEAHRHAERIAVELENTACRIRQEARRFESEKYAASAVAADVISVYVQNGSTVGAIIWQLIRDLSITK